RADDLTSLVGEERRVESTSAGLLTEADVAGDPGAAGGAQQRLERLRRHLGLEEMVVVVADALGEGRRQRHLPIDQQLDALADRLLEEGRHALDDLRATGAFVDRAQLRGGDGDPARHGGYDSTAGGVTATTPSASSRAATRKSARSLKGAATSCAPRGS